MNVQAGHSFPLGATPTAAGVNFSIFSKYATSVELLLFEAVDSPAPAQIIPLTPPDHKTF